MDMQKTLEDFHAAYNEAFNRRDAAGCAAFFSDDILLIAPGRPMTRGKEAFEEIYRSRMEESTGGTHSNKLIEYGVKDDLAYEVGTYAISEIDPPEQGTFVNILRRQTDGSWKVTVSIFNSSEEGF